MRLGQAVRDGPVDLETSWNIDPKHVRRIPVLVVGMQIRTPQTSICERARYATPVTFGQRRLQRSAVRGVCRAQVRYGYENR